MSHISESQDVDPPRFRALDASRKQIRLLVVNPDVYDAVVDCKIEVCSLIDDAHPPYEAVSYAWSHVKGNGIILADGIPIPVPAAAEEALRHLRHLDRPRTLWLDAICINQENVEERNHQVALMHEVYQKTMRTVVWLGEADESTGEAIDTILSIHNQMRVESDDATRLREVLYGEANIFQYSTTGLPDGCNFGALRTFFRRTWFQRLWVVQEAALGPQGIVYCSEHELALIDLMRTAVWIHHKQHQLPFDLDKEDGMLNASYMSAHVDRDQGWFSPAHGQRPFLADLLRYFRPFGVSEARDKVYALLGLTRWLSSGEPLPLSLIPQYQKPLSEVVRDTTRVAIQESGDLWILRYVEHGAIALIPDVSDEAVPSWVPSLFRQADQEKDPNPLRSAFRANKGLEGHHSIKELLRDSDMDLLFANGFKLGELTATGPVLSNELQSFTGIQRLLHRTLVQRSVREDPHDHLLQSFTAHDLVMSLVGGSTFDPSPMQKSGSESERSIFSSFVAALEVACQTSNIDASDDGGDAFEEILGRAEFARCAWAIRYACTNRRIFTTHSGYVGLGPQASREGDVVCILSGSRIPMVLRPANAQFEVVGPCYVHGMMQGEAGATMVERRLDLEKFVLC